MFITIFGLQRFQVTTPQAVQWKPQPRQAAPTLPAIYVERAYGLETKKAEKGKNRKNNRKKHNKR